MAFWVNDIVFKREVRICIDQNMSSTALSALGDVDTLSLEEIITDKVADAALSVVRNAPLRMLSDLAKPLTEELKISSFRPHKGTMNLPTDFERIVRFKMKSWHYPVCETLPPFTYLYSQANSGFNVFGTKDRPVLFIVPSTDEGSNLRLEIYCAGHKNDELDECLYVAKPQMHRYNDGGGIEWDILLGDELKRPTIYYTAYLVALAIKDDNAAEKLLAIAKDLLGINNG